MNDNNYLNELFNLTGRVAIITGGLGQLGTQYTMALLKAGAKVAIFDVKTGVVKKFFTDNKENPNLVIFNVDITRKASIQAGVDLVVREFGVPSILINNAALDIPPGAPADENGPFEDYPEGSLDQTYNVNLKGMILCCQVVGKMMAEHRRGSIINISSIYGNLSPDQRIYAHLEKDGKKFFKPVSYSVTKGAVMNLTRYLATYWADKNVRVNTLTLGGVFNNQDEQFLANYCHRVPLGRMATEDEYNGAILFLASDASTYMTGSNVVADGGLTSW